MPALNADTAEIDPEDQEQLEWNALMRAQSNMLASSPGGRQTTPDKWAGETDRATLELIHHHTDGRDPAWVDSSWS